MGGPPEISALKILHVEDSATDHTLIIRELRKAGHTVEATRVEDAPAMLAALASGRWDAVLCDWSLPNFSGPAALELMKAHAVDLPFIIVSGTVGEEVAVEAMRAGAHDYVIKDRLARLAPVVERERREHAIRIAARRSEAERRTLAIRLQHLTDSGMIGVVVADATGRLVEANPAFLDLLGYTRGDLEAGALSWPALTAPGSSPNNVVQLQELLAHGTVMPREKVYRHKTGSLVPALFGAAALEDDEVIAFVVDLAAQKRAEAALRSSEEQLLQAQKMEAVGRLAGGVAHDFNNVLSVILSYGEMILESVPPPAQLREDVEQIVVAGRRAAELTRQLLMFSRHEMSETRVIELRERVASMRKMIARLVGEDITLTFCHSGPPGRISADPTHIEQVVMNLVVNARDAMPVGGKLTIETANVVLDEHHARTHLGVAPGRYVMLAVSDSGVGMDRATQARIFEPFFTTKDRGKGTGLGLSTVFGIVQRAHGSVWVYSEPGVGTTFKVYLPQVEAAVDSVETVVEAPALTGTETILLVEDDLQIRTVAATILTDLGYAVLDSATPGDALRRSDQTIGRIHLLLTDVVMPQMSGPELAKRIVGQRPDTRVLYMSGYTDEALVRHGAADAGVAYLQKPITPSKLARKVRAVLDD